MCDIIHLGSPRKYDNYHSEKPESTHFHANCTIMDGPIGHLLKTVTDW